MSTKGKAPSGCRQTELKNTTEPTEQATQGVTYV